MTEMPARLGKGEVVLMWADTRHHDYVTHAWTAYPIADVLRRTEDLANRAGSPAQVATRKR